MTPLWILFICALCSQWVQQAPRLRIFACDDQLLKKWFNNNICVQHFWRTPHSREKKCNLEDHSKHIEIIETERFNIENVWNADDADDIWWIIILFFSLLILHSLVRVSPCEWWRNETFVNPENKSFLTENKRIKTWPKFFSLLFCLLTCFLLNPLLSSYRLFFMAIIIVAIHFIS